MIAAAMLCLLNKTDAQHWKSLGRGISTWGSTSINCLYGDTITSRLLAGGSFTQIMNANDTVLALGIAGWDGERWDTIAHRINHWEGSFSVNPINWFVPFEGRLFAVGSFSGFDPIDQRGVYNWAWLDTVQQRWKSVTECQLNINNSLTVLGPREPADLLYATGFRDTLCGPEEGQVFTYDGSTFNKWMPFDEIPYSASTTYTGLVFTFQGKTYVTGAFQSPFTGQWTSMLRHNGLAWEAIPGWNTNGPIKDFTIENDTLYLCGAFLQDQGAPGNLVVAYDGQNWNDLGGGLTFPNPLAAVALDVLRWQGDLYSCGVFSNAGGIPVDRLAKWNGRQWCRLPGTFSNHGPLNEMAVWRDSLYITGAFLTIDGVTMNNIAQWVGGDAVQDCSAPVGVVERNAEYSYTLHPNPTTGLLQIELHGLRPRELFVTDALGRELLRQPLPNTTQGPLQLDLGVLSPGAYLVTLVDAQGGRYVQRVVRE